MGCLKTRLDLESSSPALNKHKCCKNTKSTNHVQLIMCLFCTCCVKFLQNVYLSNVGLEQSMSNVSFKIRNNLFSECSISSITIWTIAELCIVCQVRVTTKAKQVVSKIWWILGGWHCSLPLVQLKNWLLIDLSCFLFCSPITKWSSGGIKLWVHFRFICIHSFGQQTSFNEI